MTIILRIQHQVFNYSVRVERVVADFLCTLYVKCYRFVKCSNTAPKKISVRDNKVHRIVSYLFFSLWSTPRSCQLVFTSFSRHFCRFDLTSHASLILDCRLSSAVYHPHFIKHSLSTSVAAVWKCWDALILWLLRRVRRHKVSILTDTDRKGKIQRASFVPRLRKGLKILIIQRYDNKR